MRILLDHLDELHSHIKELDDDIDSFMKLEEKKAASVLQDIPGIGNTSAQAIISVIGTDTERFPTVARLSLWRGFALKITRTRISVNPARPQRGMPC